MGYKATSFMDALSATKRTVSVCQRAHERSGVRVILSALLFMFLSPVVGVAQAQTYPSRTITVVIPFPAGANADVVGRFVADHLSKKLGTPVVVEARPGGATVPGTAIVLQQPADGHTLFESSTATNTNQLMGVKTPYDVEKDLIPVILLGITPGVLVVNPSLNVRTVQELVALSKKSKEPLLYSSPGIGSFNHLAMEQFKQKTGANIQHVPYRGFPAMMMGVMRNDVQMSAAAIPSALPNVKDGKLIALAQMGTTRMPQFPDLPTMQEAGVNGYEAAGFLGIWVKAGTPADIVALLNKEINEALKGPAVSKYAETQGIKLVGSTPTEFADFLKRDREIWAPVIKEGQIKLE